MYKRKDRQTGDLFSDILPYGGKLEEDNQWIKLSKIIPWKKIEGIYAKYFSDTGRPGKDSRLVTGLMIVKHRKSYSDRDLIDEFLENVYVQYFCGYDQFVRKGEIHYSTLSKLRKKLGKEYFEQFEKELVGVLIKEKIIRPKRVLVDATVCPANITYPTDMKLLNAAREWLCDKINWLRRAAGIKDKVRTKRRTARKEYLNFQKKKRKSKKAIQKAMKSMLRYVRRNLEQFEEIFSRAADKLKKELREEIKKRLETAKKIYEQQKEMVEKKVKQVKERIVSFHWPEVRPIVRGKDGKKVEFGPKVLLTLVDGFGFLDKMSYEAFNESQYLKDSLKNFRDRFGKLPENVIADRIFGTRWNRKLLKKIQVKEAFKPLGRAALNKEKRQEVRKAQKKRNRIEGMIGTAKNKYQLERIKYRINDGAEIWVRMGLIGMNLTAAAKRIS